MRRIQKDSNSKDVTTAAGGDLTLFPRTSIATSPRHESTTHSSSRNHELTIAQCSNSVLPTHFDPCIDVPGQFTFLSLFSPGIRTIIEAVVSITS